MATALASALTGLVVDQDLAMTGEITLRGRVLAIGGLKEKLLASKRAGIHRVLIPKENEKNLEEVPATIRRSLKIIPVAHMDEVLDEAILGSFSTSSTADNQDYVLDPEKSVHH
jgi:ATP-dependent Lon protease